MNMFENLSNLNVSKRCYNSILFLIEEYINELDDGTYRRAKDIAKALADEQEKILPMIKDEKERERTKREIAKRRRQALKAKNKYENQVVARLKKEYEESKKREN